MNYPNHKYSKYIDQEFSYSNKVDYPTKVDLVDSLKYMRCDGGIMLEPRLQEYLRKKKFYRDNHIEPCIKPEEEFLITSRDKKMLKAFLNGRTDIYDNENPEFNPFIREREKKKQYFPSKSYRDDPRVPKIDKPVMNRPVNRGMFAPEKGEQFYEDGLVNDMDPIMDARDLSDGSNALSNFESDLLASRQNYSDFRNIDYDGYDINEMGSFNPRTDRKMNPGSTKQDKHESQYRIDPNNPKDRRTYRVEMDPRNKQIITNLHKTSNLDARNCLDNLASYNENSMADYRISDGTNKYKDTRYGRQEEPSFSEKSDMNTEFKTVTPNISTKGKRGQSTFDYHMGPFIGQEEGVRDAEFETALVRGMPSHTTKSYGYRQADEHAFHYIDPDMFREPAEWWERGGTSTRRTDKSLAKQKFTREIFNR